MLKEIPIAPSTHLAAVSYDDETMILYVQFKKSGTIYSYQQVPEDVVTDLSKALSAGNHFEEFIKSSFEYKKLS